MQSVDVECAFFGEVDIDHVPSGHGINLGPGNIGKWRCVERIDNVFVDDRDKKCDAENDLPVLYCRLDNLSGEANRDRVCRHVDDFSKDKELRKARETLAYKGCAVGVTRETLLICRLSRVLSPQELVEFCPIITEMGLRSNYPDES